MIDFFYKIIAYIFFALCITNYTYAQPIEVKTYHTDEQTLLHEVYFITDSITPKLTGKYKSYLINGSLEKEGFYKNNFPDSTWTYYYENGQVKMRGQLKDGSNHGLWEYYFENGKISMAGMIIDSKRDGTWKYYFENGNLKSQGNYTGNKKNGIWNYFYEEGELKAQAFYKMDRGTYKEFYEDGKLKAEGINIHNKSDSTWVFYHENGKVEATGDYQNGKRKGTWMYYHTNGVKSAEGTFVNGEKNGKWIYYHENGNLSSEGALREGKKEGYWRIFGDDGIFKADAVFERNEGKYTEYYESGKVKAEGNVVNGKNDGLWTFYYEDGIKEGECLYENGDGQYEGFYKDGTLKMKGEIKDGVNAGIWELYKGDGSLAGYYRPYYEDNKPVYKLVEKKQVQRGNYVKPAYKYKSYKSRYFDPVINEYKGVILSINPFGTLLGQLPLSLEYYIEERLGYELQGIILRDPFYKSSQNVSLNETYDRGFSITLKQKFYHPEGKFGMFYFGQEVRVTSLKHYANVIDSTSAHYSQIKINTKETRFEYGLFVGDRWMRLSGNRYQNGSLGFTIDAYIGFGFGYRLYEKQYQSNPEYDKVFEDLNDSKFVLTPRLGISFGFIF